MRIELNKASKIVIKLGSSIIDNRDDMIINGICTSITEFLSENKEVMLVTSGAISQGMKVMDVKNKPCLLYTSPSPRDRQKSRMPSSA